MHTINIVRLMTLLFLALLFTGCGFGDCGDDNQTLQEAIIARHSVRQYKEQPIEAEKIQQLQDLVDQCNREGGLHIQLVTDEPNAFSSFIAHYSKFHGVRNYIAMICRKGDDVNLGAETFRHFCQLRAHRPRHRQVPF